MTGRSDGKTWGVIRDALSARFPFRGDIYRWFAASMTMYAVCVILLIGAISYASVDLLIRKNLRLSMESSARAQAVRLSASLDSLQESLSHLSSNSLLINAIIDTSGNRSYIDSFVKSYRPPAHDSIRLTLCDFQGNPITSNLRPPIPYKTPELLRQTVEKGLPFSTVLLREGVDNGVWLLLAYPVVWNMTGRAEGFLVSEVPVEEMIDAKLISIGNNDTGFRIKSGRRVLFSRNFVGGPGPLLFDIPLPTTAPMKALGLSMQIEDHRRIS
ncbi:MAG TPA: hypothetical protein VF514_11665, partial [Bacteroidota bacterium]